MGKTLGYMWNAIHLLKKDPTGVVDLEQVTGGCNRFYFLIKVA